MCLFFLPYSTRNVNQSQQRRTKIIIIIIVFTKQILFHISSHPPPPPEPPSPPSPYHFIHLLHHRSLYIDRVRQCHAIQTPHSHQRNACRYCEIIIEMYIGCFGIGAFGRIAIGINGKKVVIRPNTASCHSTFQFR